MFFSNFEIIVVISFAKGEKRSTEDPGGLVEAIRNALHEMPTGSKKVTDNISESETDTSHRKTRQKSEWKKLTKIRKTPQWKKNRNIIENIF